MIRFSESHFRLHTGISRHQYLEYIIKCSTGVTGTFILFLIFPGLRDDIYWVIISLMLSVTHNNKSKAALDRMRGNTVGPLVGMACWFLQKSLGGNGLQAGQTAISLFCILIGVISIITICTAFHLVSVSRTALVGFFIVMVYEDNHHSWQGALMRMFSVIIGCILGLVINKVFALLNNLLFNKKRKEKKIKEEVPEIKVY